MSHAAQIQAVSRSWWGEAGEPPGPRPCVWKQAGILMAFQIQLPGWKPVFMVQEYEHLTVTWVTWAFGFRW